MSKKIIRKQQIYKRRKFFKNIVLNYSSLKRIIQKSNFQTKKKIGLYYPINFEIDCFSLLKKLKNEKYKISFPVIKKNNQMDFFEWSSDDFFFVNKLGIPEPFQKNKVSPDIILVPVVSFDNYKYRLGYGGGYYDRYIQKIQNYKKILTIGLAFSFQKIKKIPLNKYDKKLDYIFTEKYIK